MSWLNKVLFLLVTMAYFFLISRYGSGFGVHSQQFLFTKEEYWHKKCVQTCQSSTKHSLDLEARVLNFKGAYLAHLLVFLSDSKDIILFKGLLTNHFKSSKEFSCGRNLMRKKDYKSSRWIPNFPCVTSNDHNLVNFYHLEPIIFPKWSWGF